MTIQAETEKSRAGLQYFPHSNTCVPILTVNWDVGSGAGTKLVREELAGLQLKARTASAQHPQG